MADPLSVTAGVVSLADVVWRTSKELCAFFSALKNASKNVQSIWRELQDLEGILHSINNHAESYDKSLFSTEDGLSASGLWTALKQCEKEFKILRAIVDKSRPDQGLGPVEKLVSRVTQNDITIRSKLKSTQDDIRAARTASGNQHQGVILQVRESTAETHERLSTGFTTLNGTTQAIQGDTTTLKRRFEELNDEAASCTKLIRSDVSQVNSNILKVDQVIQAGMEQTAKRQRRLGRQQVNSTRRILKGMEQLQAMVTTHIQGAPPAGRVHSDRFTHTTDNMELTVMPLMLMKSSLCEVVGKLESGGEMYLSPEELQLLQSEINEVLAAGHEASAAALRRDQLTGENGSSTAHYQTADVDIGRSPRSSEQGLQAPSTQRLRRKAAWKRFEHWTFAGVLSIGILRESGIPSSASSASITITPNHHLCKVGISIALTNELRAAMSPKISRYIRTFRVISFYGGPGYHPAVEAIRENNVLELQRFLSSKEISPWDRGTCGNGLLDLAARYWSYDVTKLILQEGGSVNSSCFNITNALQCLWRGYMSNMRFGSHAVEAWIRIFDCLIQYGACVEELESSEWGNLLFNPIVKLYRSFETSHTPERLCKYLISIGSDIEGRNKASQTPLLYATYSYYPGSVNWLRSLIANGADLTASDAKGRGPFHQMFVGFVDITRLYRNPGTVKRNSVFEAKANILLEAGCDPLQRDLQGHLPACFGCDGNIYDMWQSVLRKWTGREVIDELCFCECGGLYELTDMSTEEPETGLRDDFAMCQWRFTRIESLRRWKNGYKRGDFRVEKEGRGELGQDEGLDTGKGEELQKHEELGKDEEMEEDEDFKGDEESQGYEGSEGDEGWKGDQGREGDEDSEADNDLENADDLEDDNMEVENMKVDAESEQDEEPEEIL